jgi:hypothetical protein
MAVVVNVEIYKICTKHIKSMRENVSSIGEPGCVVDA